MNGICLPSQWGSTPNGKNFSHRSKLFPIKLDLSLEGLIKEREEELSKIVPLVKMKEKYCTCIPIHFKWTLPPLHLDKAV